MGRPYLEPTKVSVAFNRQGNRICVMSLETLMQEARKLGLLERRRLAAFLTTLKEPGEPSFADEMARRIDDSTPGHWVTLEELSTRYAADA
jgi:hypothetical protein